MTGEERATWEGLLAGAAIPDVKASPIGWSAWAATHPHGGGRLVVARDRGRPVALAALAPDHLAWRGLHARRMASAGDLHWRCGYPMTDRDVPAAIDALLDELIATGGWDVLALGPMLEDSPALDALLDVGAARGLHPMVGPAGAAPRIVVDGTWDAYYRIAQQQAPRDGGQRRAAADGARRRWSSTSTAAGPSWRRALDAFYRLEASGWKGAEGSAIACDRGLRGFYDRLADEAAARGRLRLFLLRAGDQVDGRRLRPRARRRIYMLKTGYDRRGPGASPGQVLRKHVLARLWPRARSRPTTS